MNCQDVAVTKVFKIAQTINQICHVKLVNVNYMVRKLRAFGTLITNNVSVQNNLIIVLKFQCQNVKSTIAHKIKIEDAKSAF